MRGQVMREGIEAFFQARLRGTLVPAILAIGISLCGCATGRAVAAHPSVKPDVAEEPVGDFDLRCDMDAYDDSDPPPEPLEFDLGDKK